MDSKSPGATLWDRVTQEGIAKYDSRVARANYSTLFLIGGLRSGKTTLINSFLDKEEEPKPSLPIEYTYARRTNKHMLKDVCYIWEVNISNINFIPQMIKSENLDQASVIIVVDLSNPVSLWKVCEIMAEFKSNNRTELAAVINYGMIGTKYDSFEEFTLEKKSLITRALRHYSTILDGHLVFFTKKDRTTIKTSRDLFTHLGFNTKFSHQLRSDLDGPLVIPRGGDNKSDINHLRQAFETQFGRSKDADDEDDAYDPAEDPNYSNEVIDNRRRGIINVDDLGFD